MVSNIQKAFPTRGSGKVLRLQKRILDVPAGEQLKYLLPKLTLMESPGNQGVETELECGDVVLFWRIQQMLKVQRIPVYIKFRVGFLTSLMHGLADLVIL